MWVTSAPDPLGGLVLHPWSWLGKKIYFSWFIHSHSVNFLVIMKLQESFQWKCNSSLNEVKLVFQSSLTENAFILEKTSWYLFRALIPYEVISFSKEICIILLESLNLVFLKTLFSSVFKLVQLQLKFQQKWINHPQFLP